MKASEPARILVVDDEPYIGEIIARYLTVEGYVCRIASCGEDALRVLRSYNCHLVLADIMMPGMSGIDLLNILRTLYPDVAVVMVTSVSDRDTSILAIDLGAYGYIVKPFERNELLLHVANALERRRAAIRRQKGSDKHPSIPRLVKLTRSPIRISAKKVVDLIRSGMDDAALMETFNLSAKALHSLLDQLVAAGALTQSEVNDRGSLSPGSVVIDADNLRLPNESKAKPIISAADAVKCIRSGMDDSSLMKRYNISARALRSLFGKLVASGALGQFEIDKRISETHEWAILKE
jgi:DNA-binding response OmpR family regulator